MGRPARRKPAPRRRRPPAQNTAPPQDPHRARGRAALDHTGKHTTITPGPATAAAACPETSHTAQKAIRPARTAHDMTAATAEPDCRPECQTRNVKMIPTET